MKRIAKIWVAIVYCLLFIIPLFISPRWARAAGEFTADYIVQYAVAPSGVTIVTQNVTLTNQKTNLYPQKYTIIIDSTRIKNVIAYDNGGVIRPEITQADGKTEIGLTFNDRVTGMGKQLPFSLRYESTDIAVKNGSMWEINVPGVASDPDLASYSVSLNVPPSLGPNAYMSPLPANGGKWTKDQMTRGGISAAYGTSQIFDLTLSYYLENPTVTGKRTEIALPPDGAFQKIFVRSLTPSPQTVLVDEDGNWLAQYELLPTQRLEVKAEITAELSLLPREGFTQPLTNRAVYTQPLKYWEANNSKIKELAKTYTTPRAIYNYVVSTLSYDYKRVTQTPIRKGALQALESPDNSICMEFTDLFIAVARAAGIPAREAIGYAHTTNARLRPVALVSDVLHAWPEYYDDKQEIWVPVDPTWADTTGGSNYFDKLDFNHIAFSFYGKMSDYPFPAGFYKKSGSNTKDVSVSFAKAVPRDNDPQLTVGYTFPAQATSGFEIRGQVLISNRRLSAIPFIPVSIQSSPTDVAINQQLTNIPPYATIAIPIAIPIPSYLYKGNGTIITTAGDVVAKHDFVVVPLAYRFLLPIGTGLAIVIVLIIVWIRSGLWKRRKKP